MKIWLWKMGCRLRENGKKFIREEDGLTTLEIVLIIVVLIALVMIFRDQMTQLIEKIFRSIRDNAADLY